MYRKIAVVLGAQTLIRGIRGGSSWTEMGNRWLESVRSGYERRRVGNYVRILRYCCTGIKSDCISG